MSAAENDDAILDLLTPEERAAIAEDDPEETAALARIAAGGADDSATDDDDDDDDAGDGDGAAADKTTAAPAAAPAAATPAAAPAQADDGTKAGDDGAKTTETEAAAAPAPALSPRAAYRAELPADHAEKKAELQQATDDLRAKFKSGEIEVDDYEAERSKLDEQRRALDRAETKAEISSEIQTQSIEQQWFAAVDRQIVEATKPENGGINYRADTDKMADLDAFVKTLAARKENEDKPMEWFLKEAHKRVLSLHDIKPQAKADAADPAAIAAAAEAKKEAVKAAVDKRKPPVDAVPPSLAHVPGADAAGDMGGDEFADLDKLEGIELEAAVARLSPGQREKYLAGA